MDTDSHQTPLVTLTAQGCDEHSDSKNDAVSNVEDLITAVENEQEERVLELLSRGADVNYSRNRGCLVGTALAAAAYRGNITIMKFLLDRGANVNLVGDYYGTALAAAAAKGSGESVKILLDRGANVNSVWNEYTYKLARAVSTGKDEKVELVGGDYGTALAAAAYWGNNEIVKVLLDRGANVNLVGGYYRTALVAAAYQGNNETVKLLLDRGAYLHFVGGDYGSALAAAAYQGKNETVGFLLDRRADVNLVGGFYGTALAAATHQGNYETTKLLLRRGADVRLVWGDNGSALALAASRGDNEAIKILLDQGIGVNVVGSGDATALAAAAYRGKDETVMFLLDQGADVNLVGGRYGTALAAAVYGHNDETVKLLLDQGADLNLVGGDYGTALAVAASEGKDSILEFLLNRGADPNLSGGVYGTALSAAVYGSNDESIKLLLARGANVNLVGASKCGTALAAAALRGNDRIVAFLFERGADVNLVGGDYGTALAVAAAEGKDSIVELLLNRGADLNLVGGIYGTALAAAACRGNNGIVKILLDRGADMNLVGGDYGTALATAAYLGNIETARILLDEGAEVDYLIQGEHGTALTAATYNGKTEIVKFLLDRGANINLVGGKCGTALAAAILKRNDQIVKLLLDRGADINLQFAGDRDNYGTALVAAIFQYKDDIVKLLLERGADVNLVGGRYGTAMVAAILEGKDEIVELLLDRGANVNLEGGDYGTALSAAAYQGNYQIVNLLLDRGADVNLVGGIYGTALAATAYHKYGVQIVKLLLDRGADVNLVGGDYGTALAAAAYRGKDETVEFLLDRGADVNLVGGNYGTALIAAAFGGNDGVVKLLLDRGANINSVTIINPRGEVEATALATAILRHQNTSSSNTELNSTVALLLGRGADINLVLDEYGTILGKAAYKANIGLVSFLLDHGGDIFHVGGLKYRTENGRYPTALDAAKAGELQADDPCPYSSLLQLISNTIDRYHAEHVDEDSKIWAPFPVPLLESASASIIIDVHDSAQLQTFSASLDLESILKQQDTGHGHGLWLTSEQADIPCKVLDRPIHVLTNLVGIHPDAAQRHELLIQNDTEYFVSQKYNLGMAYAAARMAWKDLNEFDQASIAVYRHTWLTKANEYYRSRLPSATFIEDRKSRNKIIQSPYQVMPRRVWDILSNRVVDYGMIHSDFCVRNPQFNTGEFALPAPFWAITHSWANSLQFIKTTINGLEWPVPLPSDLNLEKGLRKELLDIGAKYVWLDVLCLRQESNAQLYRADYLERNKIRAMEWELDVPTIGNVYRSAEALIRYFNGLGIPFSKAGWDNPRHWLQRAWTLQEIKNENITFNCGVDGIDPGTLMNTREETTGKLRLRDALEPVLKLAAEVDSPGGCSVYELAREMARRHATQPTDKVAGLLYLLRMTSLPTYSEKVTDEDAWTGCFPVLPFGRKMELLFDFPYRADLFPPPTILRRQLMGWPFSASNDLMGEFNPWQSMKESEGLRSSTWMELTERPLPSDEILNWVEGLWCSHSKEPMGRWFPTWKQLMNWPTRDPNYDHSLPASPWAQADQDDALELPPGDYHQSSIFVRNLWGISQVSLHKTAVLNDYTIEIGQKRIGFYSPYLNQSHIHIRKSQKFTLATPHPQVSSNWAVCELVETKKWKRTLPNSGKVEIIKYEVLKKVGVLRTDSCSELYVGAASGRNKLLRKINALFI